MLYALVSLFRGKDYTRADFPTLRRACCEGSEAARRAFITRFEAVAWRAVRGRMPWAPREDQEEVVADTFIALLRDDAALLLRYDPLKGLSPEGWVRRQALLQAHNRARALGSHKRKQEVLAPGEEAGAEERTRADDGPDAEALLLEQESMGELVEALLARLSPAIALTFEMLYVRELEPADAAAALGCSVDTLYTRKRRLVVALTELLEERQRGASE